MQPFLSVLLYWQATNADILYSNGRILQGFRRFQEECASCTVNLNFAFCKGIA